MHIGHLKKRDWIVLVPSTAALREFQRILALPIPKYSGTSICRSFTHRAPTREGLLPAELSRPHRDVGHHLPLAAVTLDRHLPLASEHRSSVDLGVPYKCLDAFPKILSHVMLKCDHSIYAFEGHQHHKRWIPITLLPWR